MLRRIAILNRSIDIAREIKQTENRIETVLNNDYDLSGIDCPSLHKHGLLNRVIEEQAHQNENNSRWEFRPLIIVNYFMQFLVINSLIKFLRCAYILSHYESFVITMNGTPNAQTLSFAHKILANYGIM